MTDHSLPSAWTASQLSEDNSWVLRLDAEQQDAIHRAMLHAKAQDKPLLQMSQEDFPLPEQVRSTLLHAIELTQGRWGLALIKGVPVQRWDEAETRLAYWGLGLYMGVARTQNRASEIINDVRDTGSSYKIKNGRGYNTNASLDFHQDSADIVALLCRRTAKQGGESKIISSIALRDKVRALRPDLLAVMQQAFFHSYQNTQDPSQPPYYRLPLFGNHPTHFAARTNRKNIMAVQRDFPETPRLTPEQIEALDLLDTLMPSDELCFNMSLEQGDIQLLNNYVILHSRTEFEDHDDADLKRHLLRLWLAVPSSQPLPENWQEYYGDTRAGSVRGGVRGIGITEDFLRYEAKQAQALHMLYTPWKPYILHADMQKELSEQA